MILYKKGNHPDGSVGMVFLIPLPAPNLLQRKKFFLGIQNEKNILVPLKKHI